MDLLLKTQQCTVELMEKLEQKKCLLRIRYPEPEAVSENPELIIDAPVYIGNPEYGPHMLICVGVNQQAPVLFTHPEPEQVLLINDGRHTRPLIFVISQLDLCELEKRAAGGTLLDDDLLAIEMVFNDPDLSFFSMLAGTPHCEVILDEPGEVTYFFVTESENLPSKKVDLADITLRVSR